jgi:hypothetical protein
MNDMFRLFLGYFYHDETLDAVCDYLGISAKTSYMWRAKVFECIRGCQKDVMLSKRFWLDVTFIELDRKGLVRRVLSEKDNSRYWRDRSHLSAIVVAVDDEGQTLIMHEGRGGEKLWGLRRALKGHISYESTMVNDGSLVQMGIADEYALKSEVHISTDPSSRKPMQPINSLCAQVKRVLFLHTGEDPRYLQSYLDWIHMKRELDYEYDTFAEKIDALMRVCIQSGKDLKFRDRYKD